MGANGRNFVGTIQSDPVPLGNVGIYHELYLNIDVLSATTGTVVVTLIPPGLTEANTYANSTYTVGTTIGLYIKDVVFDRVTLTPSGVDSAMTYGVFVRETTVQEKSVAATA